MNYYNDNDKHACQWLRQLIRAGLIPDGKVDDRSILDVRAADLDGFTQCHFFAGIGGWAYALQLAGWPSNRPVWTMSCPCQPFSCAGKGLGEADERHLWPYGRNLIGECRPAIVFGEQVASPDGLKWLDGVSADLERAGYAFGASDLCAAGVAAPHQRQRLYWVADPQHAERRPEHEVNRDSHGWNGFGGGGATIALAKSCGEQEHAAAKEGFHADAGCGGATPALENPKGDGRNERRPQCEGQQRQSASDGAGGVGGVEYTNGQGCERKPFAVLGATTQGYWSNYEILHMLDGKSRRVESGTFPLAHGVSGRVAQLRGLGNAIVPQVAAQFIGAYLESKPLQKSLVG